MKKWYSFFQIFFKVAALSFPAKAILLFFQCFLPRNVSKSSFFLKETNFFLFSQGRVEIFLSRRLEIVVPREGKNPCCPQGLPLLSQGIIFVLRGDESAQRAPSDAKSGTSDTTPSPRVTQKGLFKGREGKNEWFSAAKFFFTASIFAVSATNVIGYFFILVKGFCNRLFFYFIGFGRYKAAAGGFEKGVKPFWL